MRRVSQVNIVAAILGTLFFLIAVNCHAHRSGCHRWHSCPSDSGSYVCGDSGYCSQCPDNQYCRNRQFILSNSQETIQFEEQNVIEKMIEPLTPMFS